MCWGGIEGSGSEEVVGTGWRLDSVGLGVSSNPNDAAAL